MLKMKTSREFYSKVSKQFGTMPFNLRSMEEEKKARMGVVECVTHKLIEPFQVLFDKEGAYVAQFKFTVLLMQQGGRYKSWKRRWFILNDNCLYYFEFTTDKEPRGIIPLENIKIREVADRSKQHCFELFCSGNEVIKACKTDSEGKVVEGKHTVYRMSASTEEEKDDWIKCIQRSISHNPFYDMLAVRKKKVQ